MKKELEQKLFDACPLFYRFRLDTEGKTTHRLMDLGICCGDGWYQLLLDVSLEIEEVIKNMQQQEYKQDELPAAVWVREKHGELYIHMENETDETMALSEKAEAKSVATCEVCGQAGIMRNRGWITCLCNDCVVLYPLGLDIDD